MKQRLVNTNPTRARPGLSRRSCLLAGAVVGSGLLLAVQSASAADVGKAPQWPTIRLLDGAIWAPASWSGQPSVVVFWASWCPFCRRHNAHVDKLARATAKSRLRIVAIAVKSDVEAVRRYMAANHYQFQVTLDGGALRQQLGLRSMIPMTCVFDRQGRLSQVLPGEMSEDDVMELAKLAEPAAS
ncbi:MAG: TlpA family protein disulfide reductase [Pseudomonadota bacterium]|nr:TlpA family protein disulfide reductase [Pseudomonadota bacterium]